MGPIRGSVSKLLAGTLLTDELFRAECSRDDHPIRVKNGCSPRSWEMLLGQHVLEDAVGHPDDHRVEPSSAFILNGYINELHPVVFNAAEMTVPCFTQPQKANSRRACSG